MSNKYINKKFGRLTVIDKTKTGYLCKCKCGTKKIFKRIYDLTSGNTKSCGCLKIEKLIKYKKANRKFKPKDAPARKLWTDRYKEIPFKLFLKLTSQNCFYCGSKPFCVRKIKGKGISKAILKSKYVYNGIDRIDSSKSYTKDNIVTCCKYCNTAKSNRNLKDFTKWIKKIYTHMNLNDRL